MQHASFSNSIRVECFALMAFKVFTICTLFAGCQRTSPPSTGGDSPVTTERLSGTRLTDIHQPLSWIFTDSTVVIEYDGKPIPADLANVLLGEGSTPKKIEAFWRLDELTGTLRLTGMKADQTSIDKEVAVPIAPAGHVRLNLGARQYNMFRAGADHP